MEIINKTYTGIVPKGFRKLCEDATDYEMSKLFEIVEELEIIRPESLRKGYPTYHVDTVYNKIDREDFKYYAKAGAYISKETLKNLKNGILTHVVLWNGDNAFNLKDETEFTYKLLVKLTAEEIIEASNGLIAFRYVLSDKSVL